MAEILVVKIMRVKEGDYGSHPVSLGGITGDVFPANGFVITTNHPGQLPLFIRDGDVKMAEDKYEETKKPIAIQALSWGD